MEKAPPPKFYTPCALCYTLAPQDEKGSSTWWCFRCHLHLGQSNSPSSYPPCSFSFPSPHSPFTCSFFLLLPYSPSEPWPRRLFPVWAPARFLQGEECTGGPPWVAINISSLPCLHLCRVLNDGIFMKRKYLHWKAVSQRPARVEGKIIERSLRHF